MTKSQLFVKAHSIARATVAVVTDYRIAFSLALKALYAELKAPSTESKLLALGLTVWEKGGKKRIYVNTSHAEAVFGLAIKKYKTGNIKHALLQGEEISHSKAAKLLAGSTYYDCLTETYCGSLAEYATL